jgi:Flp pilus assembly protein TadD
VLRSCLIGLIVVISAGLAEAAGAPGGVASAGLEEADRLAQQGQIDQALALYRELSARQPEAATVHARVAGMLLLKQEYAAAVPRFQTAIGLGPEKNAEAFIGLGVAYLHLGRYGPARAALTEARRLKPESAADIDQLLAWLDRRSSDPGSPNR